MVQGDFAPVGATRGFPVAPGPFGPIALERTLTREAVQSVVDGVIADLEKQGVMLKK